MQTSNPTMSSRVFDAYGAVGQDVMTVQGTGYKTMILLGLAAVSAAFTWVRTNNAVAPNEVMPWVFGGLIVGLILSLATIFKPNWSPITAPAYALAEGLFLGAISAIINQQYPGIAFQAICLTFGTMFCMLMGYQTGVIKVTERFRAGVMAGIGAIFLLYLVSMVMSFFGSGIPFIHESGPIGIGFSVVVVGLAALSLVLDFDFIYRASEHGAPKFMEWYGAFALMTTLVWLYIEILRLLSKLQRD